MNSAPPARDLVLLGGGHTHALALRRLTMRPPPATRISLVSDSSYAPYSGMLPGLVAGHYSVSDAHIDLRGFCAARGIRFIEARATGLDSGLRQLFLSDRPPISFDVLSINIGAQPELDSVPGARDYATPVKPVSGFYPRWQALEQRLSRGDRLEAGIVLVGGGAGSVELALAMRHRLDCDDLPISILCGDGLLPSYNRGARSAVRRFCERQQITILEQARVIAVGPDRVEIDGRDSLAYDELVWCTGVVPVTWLGETGLALDERGFLLVEDTLQVLHSPGIFAAGDVAVQRDHPRPRAGVFAVRQAPTLAHNLQALLAGKPLREHRPQRRFLSLLSLGSKEAVADRGPLWASGPWIWRWKDRIDREFMDQFLEPPPPMKPGEITGTQVHCGGCGAKVPAAILRAALAQLAREQPDNVDPADLQDDAAVLDWQPGDTLVQTVDTLRGLVDDPWVMGRIAALHALSDIYAMGAQPHSAQVQVCLPYASPELQERELVQLMSGITRELRLADCQLVGGHSMEGPELTVGLTINGKLVGERPLSKTGAQPGDRLILTKPLGTGVVFAGVMAGHASGRALAAACDSMLESNREPARLAREYGASGCTDLTGFGLLGHLLEMTPAGGLHLVLDLSSVPALPGVARLFADGVRSTLHPGNLQFVSARVPTAPGLPPILFDPQTSGGLLISAPAAQSDSLLNALAAAGSEAAIIGEFHARRPDGLAISVVS